MDLYVFQKFKIIAYVSYKLILHYVNICKFFDKYLVRFKIKTFRSSHYDYIKFEKKSLKKVYIKPSLPSLKLIIRKHRSQKYF